MNNKLELAQDRIIETVGNMCNEFGLNQFIAQLYMVLYLNKEPLSLDDLVERLRVSKGNVSINIRELEKWGAVRRVWIKGSRRDYYEAELDIKKVFLNKLKSSVLKRISEVSDMIGEFTKTVQLAENELTKEEKEIASVYQERLKKIEELRALASRALSVAERFL